MADVNAADHLWMVAKGPALSWRLTIRNPARLWVSSKGKPVHGYQLLRLDASGRRPLTCRTNPKETGLESWGGCDALGKVQETDSRKTNLTYLLQILPHY